MNIGNIECYGVIYKITNLVNNKCCKGKQKLCGKLADGTKLVWKYLVWKHDRVYRVEGGGLLV